MSAKKGFLGLRKRGLRGPGGLMLVLDPNEVVADNPGEGTPAMVYLFGASATYWCAECEGELEGYGRNPCRELTERQMAWLQSQEISDAVEACEKEGEAAYYAKYPERREVKNA